MKRSPERQLRKDLIDLQRVIVKAEADFKHRKILKGMFTGPDAMRRKQNCGLLPRVAPLRARGFARCFVDKNILMPEEAAVLAAGS
ncbi:MAG TPA: hypothetical protein VKP61_05695 [Candidatus Acidoferrum sp.]|nr:hypothetical protein [Candidatus Acidoferrum sp.]